MGKGTPAPPKPAGLPAPPPPPPPAPEAPPTAPVIDPAKKNTDNAGAAKKKGTSALRIDLNVGGSGKTGLNIP
jgi:hypothetical protein